MSKISIVKPLIQKGTNFVRSGFTQNVIKSTEDVGKNASETSANFIDNQLSTTINQLTNQSAKTKFKDRFLNSIIPFRKRIKNAAKAAIELKKNEVKFVGENPLIKSFEPVIKVLTSDKEELMNKLKCDPRFMSMALEYAALTDLNILNLLDKSKANDVLLNHFLKKGVGPNKLLQVISSDEEIIAKLKPEIQKAAKSVKSDCYVSRTLNQAVDYANALLGGKYLIQKGYGAGTIAEAYLANTKEGKEVVIKMIKNGVTERTLELERLMMNKIVETGIKDTKIADYQTSSINNLYENWSKELKFFIEKGNASELAKDAKRYEVTKVLDIADNGKAIVYEKAKGVSVDKLVNMINDYKLDSVKYMQKYKNEIQEFPWLAGPEAWMKDMPYTYNGALNEMIFIPKGLSRILHGDPHSGNVFMHFDEATKKLKPTFIDLGLAIDRPLSEMTEHLGFMANYLVGNTKGLAQRYLEQSSIIPAGKSNQELIDSIASKLDKNLFKAKINLCDFDNNQKIIDKILDEEGVIISPEFATFMKIQFQSISTTKELLKLTGQKFKPNKIVPDVANGLRKSIQPSNFKTAKENISEPLNYIRHNFDHAMTTLMQFLQQ